MTTIAIHSIRSLASSEKSLGWRIASAVVSAAIADLTVTREEPRELSPARALLLETIRAIEQEEEGRRADVVSVGNLAGIADPALMAGILLPLAEQGLVIIDGEQVTQNPALIIEGDQARIIVDRQEEVCVLGSPPLPAHGIDRQLLKKLGAFDADTPEVGVSEGELEEWRAAFWDERTHRLQLREPLEPRLHVLEGWITGAGPLVLRDEKYRLRVNLPMDHPFMRHLLAEAQPILDAASHLLAPYGQWDAGKAELSCTGEQWKLWCEALGGDFSEVILRGALDLGLEVRCRPVDGRAAHAMLLENVMEGLDAGAEPCTMEEVERLTSRERQSPLLSGHDLSTPTLAEVEFFAWESGRWELAYRIAKTADGL